MRKILLSQIHVSLPETRLIGDENHSVNRIVALDSLPVVNQSECIAWVSDKNLEIVADTVRPGLLILSEAGYERLGSRKLNFLVCSNPRETFSRVVALFFEKRRSPEICSTAIIHSSALVGKDCYIGHHVVIEDGVIIGDRCTILHNTVLMEGTILGNDVMIGCNCTIGNRGFGYEKNAKGEYVHIPHIGNVVIEDCVEIHDNISIARAPLGRTVVSSGVKIDSITHVGHGAIIGKNSIVIQSVIAGSVQISENCWIGPGTIISNKVKFGKDSRSGPGSIVLTDIPSNNVVSAQAARNITSIYRDSK